MCQKKGQDFSGTFPVCVYSVWVNPFWNFIVYESIAKQELTDTRVYSTDTTNAIKRRLV
jgi:hypothetical protein